MEWRFGSLPQDEEMPEMGAPALGGHYYIPTLGIGYTLIFVKGKKKTNVETYWA